jgi:hypothetical protein
MRGRRDLEFDPCASSHGHKIRLQLTAAGSPWAAVSCRRFQQGKFRSCAISPARRVDTAASRARVDDAALVVMTVSTRGAHDVAFAVTHELTGLISVIRPAVTVTRVPAPVDVVHRTAAVDGVRPSLVIMRCGVDLDERILRAGDTRERYGQRRRQHTAVHDASHAGESGLRRSGFGCIRHADCHCIPRAHKTWGK